MTFVPWERYNICKRYALSHGKCKHEHCPWDHPSQEELGRIWDAHDESKAPRGGAGVTKEPPRPLREGVVLLEHGHERARAASLPTADTTLPGSVMNRVRLDWEHDHSQPPSSNNFMDRGVYPDRARMLPPRPEFSSPAPSVISAARTIDSYRPPPHVQHPVEDGSGQHFDPAHSSNDFVNGAIIYRFVWGNPLCVRCGVLGHLPAKCRNTPLSMPEQDFLYKLMKKEQARSKGENPQPGAPQAESDSSSREASAEPQVLWQRRGSFTDDHSFALPSQAGKSDWLSYRQRFPEQREQNPLLPNEGENAALQERTSLPTGHRRDFIDFGEFVGGARDQQSCSVPSRLNTENCGRSLRARQGKGARVEVNPAAALAPVASNLMHPSRVALVDGASSAPSGPPSSEASVPAGHLLTTKMGATKRMSNGEAKIIGPHPSTIRVSASYITQAAIDKRLAPEGLDAQERSLAEAREDTVRLQGVAWLDNVRRALQLPVKTFTTAVVYYHKFRLAHPKEDYQWVDAAAASLLTSCKNEDTLKKSRDILAAAYNMKQPNSHEQVGADDPMFEAQSRMVIGIERLILESGGFDFRSRAPHHTLVKIGKSLPNTPDRKDVSQLAWTVLTDLHRTFAPLKQTSSTLALASLELAAHFTAVKSDDHTCMVRDNLQELDLRKWHTSREEVMETLLDALDLYTHNTASSILGTKYSLDDLLRIRLALNKECSDSSLPRYTMIQPPPSPDNASGTGNTLRVANGHPTPVSPPQPGAQAPQQVNAYTATSQHTPQTEGTLRFMLNPQRATEERARVTQYYTEEWEEYEEEIELPLPRDRSRERGIYRDQERDAQSRRDRDRDRDRNSGLTRDTDGRRGAEDRNGVDRRNVRDSPRAAPPLREPRVVRQPQSNMLQSVVRAPSPAPEILVEKDDDKDSQLERARDRARSRDRDRDRDRRYDDRRSDGRDRYESRRDRDDRDDRERIGGGGSRRYYDDDRRRDRR